jgi:hypothetical protein
MNHYKVAQVAMANLKASVYELLALKKGVGLTNAQIGRALGIYTGHKGHEGHIPRTLLAIMENEGVVKQNEDKTWVLC